MRKNLRVDHTDATFESILKRALASPAGQNLRFQDQVLRIEFDGDLFGFRFSLGHSEIWHGNSRTFQQGVTDVLVHVQVANLLILGLPIDRRCSAQNLATSTIIWTTQQREKSRISALVADQRVNFGLSLHNVNKFNLLRAGNKYRLPLEGQLVTQNEFP